ncbi:glycosyltransferase family 2 protein [Ciceribacter thiooxidans]|uniref:Glycosyltransferase family 2 protein n=1 Tax=Ciceribacter thiooxidans TaxID=1969821 RepID=A0ABV7I1P8_9HYPH|nr:glycosyltransferase family 2 protein [Ciceribacter thiooxidans]
MIEPTCDVTVVIAAFNAESTIERAIVSALMQDDVSVEVIVVDDCSRDTTRETVLAIDDPRVRLIAHERNKGPGGARNTAFDAASGRWLAVLDADDTIYSDRLSRLVHQAEETGADVIVDNLDIVSPQGVRRTMFAEADLSRRPWMTLEAFISSNVLFRSTYNYGYMKPVFSRSFLDGHGLRFDESLRIGEDYILLASALAAGGRCTVCPRVGYAYHLTDGSISSVLKRHHVEAMLAADAAFVQSFPLDTAALRAQRRRRRSLEQARSFLVLVDHFKQRAVAPALVTALRDPLALRHLRMPIAARLRRLIGPQASTMRKDPTRATGPHTSKG